MTARIIDQYGLQGMAGAALGAIRGTPWQDVKANEKPSEPCPHPEGSAAAILWGELQRAKKDLSYVEHMIKEYVSRKEAADAKIAALEDAIKRLTD